MIPQEVADLADGLIAELGHDKLTRDEAISMANRLIRYMRVSGWVVHSSQDHC